MTVIVVKHLSFVFVFSQWGGTVAAVTCYVTPATSSPSFVNKLVWLVVVAKMCFIHMNNLQVQVCDVYLEIWHTIHCMSAFIFTICRFVVCIWNNFFQIWCCSSMYLYSHNSFLFMLALSHIHVSAILSPVAFYQGVHAYVHGWKIFFEGKKLTFTFLFLRLHPIHAHT